MHLTEIAGKEYAQFTIRVDLRTGKMLERLRKKGRFKSVNCLVNSILSEIALDERTERKRKHACESNNSVAQHATA